MLVVIDANEIFSLLIRGSKDSEAIFFSDEVELIAPEVMMVEFSNNKEEILSKTHRIEEEFSRMVSLLERRINLIPKQDFEEFIERALKLLSGHSKDAPYLALALKYKCPLWSEEKLLKEQPEVKVFNTKELSAILGS